MTQFLFDMVVILGAMVISAPYERLALNRRRR
jgi:hypothetical protein